jgi:glycine cleavage system H protein
MDFPKDLRYTKEHEWARIEDDQAVVGITEYAQEELGDVVYIDLPSEGDQVTKKEAFGTVESVKAVSDLYAPLSGVVVKVNQALEDQPELVNKDSYGEGWLIVIKSDDQAELVDLLDAEAYGSYVAEEKASH